MVQIQLLGGVTATADAGAPVDLGPPKCRALLAALALSVGEAVPVTRLVDLVWGDEPPRTASKIVQGYVARLRRALGADAIERVGAAYRLSPSEVDVDVARFRARVTGGDVAGALEAWTGTPLAGVDAPGLTAVTDGLVEQWLVAVEEDLAGRVDTDPAGAVGPLTELTTEHPFREGLWALLMTALYRAGRQADALAAFQQARQHLVDELGVEPGTRLRQLEARILDQDPALREIRDTPEVAADERPSRPTGTVTFGAVQVAGATHLWAEHRRKMALAMTRFDTLARATAAEHAGTVFSSSGEALVVAFHRAEDAGAWARELQLATEQEPWPGGIDVRLQVGLHTGETVEHDGGYVGSVVHTVVRLAAAGHAGQTLVSGVTAELLGRDDLRHLGTHRLEGSESELEVLQLDDREHPALRSVARRGAVLPERLVRLVGRDDDLRSVLATLDGARVVTLVGPGGIGKTTLALEAARRWVQDGPRRAYLVELADVTEPGDVPRAVAGVVGVTESAGGDPLVAALGVIRAHPTLVVLDNGEHVVEAAAAVARYVAEQAPGARVLTTSREALAIVGEQVVPLAPLSPAGAGAELFLERARAASGAAGLEAERPVVEEICRRVDGIPLAIELAAARTRSLDPAELLARLDDHLRVLGGGDRTAAERHRTLRATVQWSHDLLSVDQQRLFARLSVFVGPFDLAAAEEVADDAEDVDQLLGDLVERSMVAVQTGPFGRTYRVLETLRQFASEQLATRGERAELERRHAAWCLTQVEEVHGLLAGHGEVAGVARLGALWSNLRAAVDRACAAEEWERAAALVAPIVTEVNLRRQAEIGDWAERLLALIPAADDDAIVFWLGWALHRHMQAGDRPAHDRLVGRYAHADHPLVAFTRAYLFEDGAGLCTSALPAASWLRDQGHGLAADLVEMSGMGSGLMTTGRFQELDEHIGAMAVRFASTGPPTLHYFALGMLGYGAQLRGCAEDAMAHFRGAADVEVPAGTYAASRPAEARALFEDGQVDRALRMLHEHVSAQLETDYVDVARLVAVEFIAMAVALGRPADAAPVLGYLDTTGDFGQMARAILIADAAEQVQRAVPGLGSDPSPPDARDAMRLVRDGLEAMAATRPPR